MDGENRRPSLSRELRSTGRFLKDEGLISPSSEARFILAGVDIIVARVHSNVPPVTVLQDDCITKLEERPPSELFQ